MAVKTSRKKKNNSVDGVEVGHLMLAKIYVRVDSVDKKSGQNVIGVTNLDNGQEFQVRGDELINKMDSADQYDTVEKVTMTRLAEVLTSSHVVPLTVNFVKTDGSERTMRCRFLGIDDLMGRSHVEDLDIDRKKHRNRQVDHRNINWIIVGKVKYEKK